ncbi:MAG: hypothetical protein AAGE52_04580 [Myxococcota bacterium]
MTRILTVVLALTACKGPQSPSDTPLEPSRPVLHPLTVESGPGEVDDNLIAHIQAEDYAAAYQLMATPYRESVPIAAFEDAVSHNAYLRSTRSIGCPEIQTWEGRVHRRQCILESDVGSAHATLFYALETEGWRMTGMLIGGTPAFPHPQGSGEEPSD